MLKVELNGKEYPCGLVMGALLRFKRETGKDVSQMKQDDLEDLLMLMWCCVKCSSQAENIDFPMDFETFCNSITPAVLNGWNERIGEAAQKKRAKGA
ncbi:hypothetical protein C7120_01740 [Prevotella sp. oral taxon 376]|uniref:hypothetical protein n=1 Tax=Prevotella sp. oral taxon 376 TaxID=712466 RepID=UPI000D1E7D87|nr:hypothetical protein [Prevotella sp. oral taxon 376]PTL33368.1 hypothetical protein C7120_01740 [Prevotella sp. oral taxon 376]